MFLTEAGRREHQILNIHVRAAWGAGLHSGRDPKLTCSGAASLQGQQGTAASSFLVWFAGGGRWRGVAWSASAGAVAAGLEHSLLEER